MSNDDSGFYEKINRCADRRQYAVKKSSECSICGSEQVQLTDYLGDYIKFRCRRCKHEWSINDEWKL